MKKNGKKKYEREWWESTYGDWKPIIGNKTTEILNAFKQNNRKRNSDKSAFFIGKTKYHLVFYHKKRTNFGAQEGLVFICVQMHIASYA